MKKIGFWMAVIFLNITVFVGVSLGFGNPPACTHTVKLCVGWSPGGDHIDCCEPSNGGETYAVGDLASPGFATGLPAANTLTKCGKRSDADKDAEGVWRCNGFIGTCGDRAVISGCVHQ